LRAGERAAQSFVARKWRADGQRIQISDQACIVKEAWSLIEGESSPCFAGWQKLECARNIAAGVIEKGAVIGSRHAERPSRRVAVAFFRQKAP
jgi:hypothetical protein